MEDTLDEKLDMRQFPFLSNRPPVSTQLAGARYKYNKLKIIMNICILKKFYLITSARPTWHRATGQPEKKIGPRLIVFIVGGVCYSEMRSAYEVTTQNKKWEVIIGSDQIITSRAFLNNLSENDSLNDQSNA